MVIILPSGPKVINKLNSALLLAGKKILWGFKGHLKLKNQAYLDSSWSLSMGIVDLKKEIEGYFHIFIADN